MSQNTTPVSANVENQPIFVDHAWHVPQPEPKPSLEEELKNHIGAVHVDENNNVVMGGPGTNRHV